MSGGKFGVHMGIYGVPNEAWRELLTFFSINEATICSSIHKATWQRPTTRKWHCIDSAIARQSYHRRCGDVAVVRDAECGTDHRMLWMELEALVKGGLHKTQRGESAMGRFDVAKLYGLSVGDREELTEIVLYQESMGKKVRES